MHVGITCLMHVWVFLLRKHTDMNVLTQALGDATRVRLLSTCHIYG